MARQRKTAKKLPALRSKVDDILQRPYARILIPNEGGSYTAEMLEFPGCISEGRTAKEALENLEEAAKGWVEVTMEEGRDIPLPCNDYNYSGRIALRLPRGLHRQASRMAERENCSLNQFIATSLATRVGISDFFNKISEQLSRPVVQIHTSFTISTSTAELVADPVVIPLDFDPTSGKYLLVSNLWNMGGANG